MVNIVAFFHDKRIRATFQCRPSRRPRRGRNQRCPRILLELAIPQSERLRDDRKSVFFRKTLGIRRPDTNRHVPRLPGERRSIRVEGARRKITKIALTIVSRCNPGLTCVSTSPIRGRNLTVSAISCRLGLGLSLWNTYFVPCCLYFGLEPNICCPFSALGNRSSYLGGEA
jgi:hypothetical protein